MSLRRALLTLPSAVLLGACAIVAHLDATYLAGAEDSGVDGIVRVDGSTSDSGVARDSMSDVVTLEDAAGDADAAACVAQTCADLAFTCGSAIPNGCGALIASCGDCPDGSTCGGGGGPNKCGAAPCTPSVCTPSQCGSVPDGCGAVHSCPTTCSAPLQCKAGGRGGCIDDGVQCAFGKLRWPAWLCDDTGTNRGGQCDRVAAGPHDGQAYYCCPPF